MNKILLTALILLAGPAACNLTYNEGDAERSGNVRKEVESEKVGVALTDLWSNQSPDGDHMLILAPNTDNGRYCYLKKIRDIKWNDQNTFADVKFEFVKGSASINRLENTDVLKLDRIESSCDGLQTAPENEKQHLITIVDKNTSQIALGDQTLRRNGLSSGDESAMISAGTLLKLLEVGKKGCFIDGKFVENPLAKPTC